MIFMSPVVLIRLFITGRSEDYESKDERESMSHLCCILFHYVGFADTKDYCIYNLDFFFMMFHRSDQKWARLILIIKSFTMHSSSESNMLLSGCYRL